MSFANFTSLRDEIADWLARDDLTTQIQSFVDLCESEMNRRLRLREMETKVTLPITSEFVALPDDFLELRDIYLSNSPNYPLQYVAPEVFTRKGAMNGSAVYYTIIGSEIGFKPASGSAILTYYAKIDDLDSGDPTNFVLESYPNLYLSGTMKYASLFIKDIDEANRWGAMFEAELASVQGMSRASKAGHGMMMKLA